MLSGSSINIIRMILSEQFSLPSGITLAHSHHSPQIEFLNLRSGCQRSTEAIHTSTWLRMHRFQGIAMSKLGYLVGLVTPLNSALCVHRMQKQAFKWNS